MKSIQVPTAEEALYAGQALAAWEHNGFVETEDAAFAKSFLSALGIAWSSIVILREGALGCLLSDMKVASCPSSSWFRLGVSLSRAAYVAQASENSARIAAAVASLTAELRDCGIASADVEGICSKVLAISGSPLRSVQTQIVAEVQNRIVTLVSMHSSATTPLNFSAQRDHSVLLIHGIRTQAEWAQRVAKVLEDDDPTLRVVPTRYEFFDLIRFLIPSELTRQQAVDTVRRRIRDELSRKPKKLSVIAHSFGTYIVSKVLEQDADVCFERIVLCGSIIPDSFGWESYKHRMGSDADGWQVLNDCGAKDVLPILAKSVTWGYGSPGRLGFGHGRVRDRFHSVGHSGFFTEKFVRRYWGPYISKGEIVDGNLDTDRPQTPLWMSLLTIIKLRYLLIAAVVWTAYHLSLFLLPRIVR